MKRKSPALIACLLIPAALAALFSLFRQTASGRAAEGRIYDLLLRLRPPASEHPAILLVDIDGGKWSWSRAAMADGLVLMAEFDARYALFDIECGEESPRGINDEVLSEAIPEIFKLEFASLQQNTNDLFRALYTGVIPLKDAEEYVQDLVGLTGRAKANLLARVQEIARDDDRYLGQAARLFGKAYFPVILPEGEEAAEPDPALLEQVRERIALKNVTADQGPGSGSEPDAGRAPATGRRAGLQPAIAPILQGAAGAGFPGTIVDPDGIRRRVELIRRYDDRFFAQLAMTPLLDWLGNPAVLLEPGRVRLAGARLPEGGERDLSIPLAEDGCLLLDWPPKSYLDSYRHLPFHELALHRELERRLLRDLRAMEEAGLFGEPHRTLLELYRYAQTIHRRILESGDRQPLAEYRRARERFFREADRFLQGETEQELLGRIQTILDSDEAAPEEKRRAAAMDGRARELFSSSRGIYRELARSRVTLREYLPGAFCIIGLAGTPAAETGVTPFGEQHGSTGAHAAVVNTILGGRFLDDLPWWYSAVLAVLLAGDLALLLRNLRPLGSILAGAAVLLLLLAGGSGLFLGAGVYPGLLTPALTVLFTSLALASMKLLRIGRERRFLRRAFGQGISADAIEELIDQPSVLQVGGEKRILTAMFTGVKDSATLLGRLDPADLVKLTRGYLTEMSDIILELKGTIDRYEGHTIASFFGAPLACPDHASRACLAAVRMKKAEALLSERLSREGLRLPPLLTRVGINTGEMVVGGMGSARWMDYTIMGDAANLAARLVGVNRQYGTWILIGESTCRAAEAAAAGPADPAAAGAPSGDFLLRKMDRVKAAGIAEPVRLFELLDEKSSASPEMREAVEAFHQGLRHFEAREWTAARRRFQEVLRILPGDGPSGLFLKRCIEFARNPPPVSWDGVFSLSMK